MDAWGLPKCEREEYYELWFVEENGEHVSAGSFTVDESGDAELDLTAPRFATSYQRIGVTVERDKDPRPSGVMIRSMIRRTWSLLRKCVSPRRILPARSM